MQGDAGQRKDRNLRRRPFLHYADIKTLHDEDAAVDAADQIGRKLLDLASQDGHLDVSNHLLDKDADFHPVDDIRHMPLHLASNEGYLDVVKHLLDKGSNVDTTDRIFGCTPLHLAAEKGQLDVVKILLDKGANIGHTPLHLASQNGYLDVVKHLIDKRANVNTTDWEHRTPIHFASQKGYLEVVKYLLDKVADVNRADERGHTPLHVASQGGYLDTVKYLLDQGADVNTTDEKGRTPLHVASQDGHLNVVKHLHDQGADLNTADETGHTPLHLASQKAHLDVVKYLLDQGADVNRTDEDGHTPLHLASCEGHLDVVKHILHEGVNVDTTDEKDQRLLLMTFQNGHLDVVEHLLNKGVNVNTTDEMDRRLLLLALQKRHLDVVKQILLKSADRSLAQVIDGKLLLMASQDGDIGVVKHLVDKGADVNTITKTGHTPLHLASYEGHLDVVKYLLAKDANVNSADEVVQSDFSTISIMKVEALHATAFGISNGTFRCQLTRRVIRHYICADLNTAEKIGRTSLLLASQKGHSGVVKHLLDKGADVNTAEKDGRTPLHLASHEGHLDVVKHLLDKGAKVNSLDEKRLVPLFLASQQGHVAVVKYLLDNGADVTIADQFGWTSLHRAAYCKHEDVAMLLVEAGADMNIETIDGKKPCDVSNDDNLSAILNLGRIRRCFGTNMVPILAQNPKTVRFLADSNLYATMRIIQQNPSKLYKHRNDPRILVAFTELDKVTSPYTEHSSHSNHKDILASKDTSGVFSIQPAIEVIRRTIRQLKNTSSDVVLTAKNILSLSKIPDESIATGVMVVRVLSFIIRHGIPTEDSNLLQVLKDIQRFYESTLQNTQTCKLMTHDFHRLAAIQDITVTIVRLQDRLCLAVEYLNVNLKLQVVGDVYDSTFGIENMMKTMRHIDECLAMILKNSNIREQADKFQELTIQMKRGLEYYIYQVEVGNIARNEEFEGQIEKCQYKIEETVRAMNNNKANKTRYSIDQIESWMLAYDDVDFNPLDITSALGRGGFGTVFRGEYHGQEVAVKRFDQIVIADSADLEELIVKEVKAWKEISHERYILTLIGVCTKVAVPILVCELCDTNIRRYVRNYPETLLPMACGLLSLHSTGIIH
ncbi:hypothetical protein AeNC1_004604 [Aphanomyces euteiches]|nr:hypothetical protein AeNC1_004604 [Aphanomyces euteiches]